MKIKGFNEGQELKNIDLQSSTQMMPSVQNKNLKPQSRQLSKLKLVINQASKNIVDYDKLETDKEKYEHYLRSCEKLLILPNPIRTFKFDEKKNKLNESAILNFDEKRTGDKYAQILSKIAKNPEQIKLSSNRLTSFGANAYLQQIDFNLDILDLSYNPKIEQSSYLMIREIVENPYRRLRQLNLEGNNIGDETLNMLRDAFTYSCFLKYLNLSKNNLTDKSSESIKEILKQNNTLVILLLHWNFYKARGAINIFEGIKVNDVLKIFDISNNQIGPIHKIVGLKPDPPIVIQFSDDESKIIQPPSIDKLCALAIGETFQNNQTLIHIDLSNNHLSENQCKIIHKYLRLTHVHSRFSFQQSVGQIKSKSKLDIKSLSNCWICEGWTQVAFEFNPKHYEETKNLQIVQINKVYLHLSFEPDQIDQMDFNDKLKIYQKMRMVPPGQLTYSFSIELKPKNEVLDQEIKIVISQQELIVPKTDMHKMILQQQMPLDQNYINSLICKPRPYNPDEIISEDEDDLENIRKQMQILKKEKEKQEMSALHPKIIDEEPLFLLRKSVFKDYIPDSNDLVLKCFEYDWNCSRITNVVKNEQERIKIKKLLWNYYKGLRECYKYYAGVSPANGVFSIGQNVMREVITQSNMIDGKLCKLADIDVECIAVNAFSKVDSAFNPDRQLVRYELMEVIVRIAIHKYYKSKQVASQTEAIEKMFNEGLQSFINKFDCDIWRQTRFWNRDCNDVLLYNKMILDELFNKYTGRYVLPGQQKFCSLEEFIDMITHSGVVSDTFGSREIGILISRGDIKSC
eukprot:403349416